MVKQRQRRGQPGNKVGGRNRRWMLEENSIGLSRGKKLFLYASLELCARRNWCGYPGRGLGDCVILVILH